MRMRVVPEATKYGSGFLRLSLVVLFASCVAAATGPAAAQGTLEAVREDIGGGGPVQQTPSGDDGHNSHDDDDDDDEDDGHSCWDCCCCDDDDSGTVALIKIAAIGIASPYWGPNAVFESGQCATPWFAPFPYDGVPGYMTRSAVCQEHRPSSRRLEIDYSGDLDRVDRLEGRLLWEGSYRIGLDTQVDYLREDLPLEDDELWMGDANIVIRFAQNEHWQWRSGGGLNWSADEENFDLGFNFTYGFDYFPRKPWVLSANLDWGTIGDAELFRFRPTAGVVIDRFETYVGYEYLDIDRTQFNMLIGGVGVWF